MLEKPSFLTSRREAMTALVEKLSSIAGGGKLSEREWRVRCRLKWHTKPKSSVRHLLYGERKPSIEEARQIEAAHFKLCAEKIQEHDEATKRLFENMRIASWRWSSPIRASLARTFKRLASFCFATGTRLIKLAIRIER